MCSVAQDDRTALVMVRLCLVEKGVKKININARGTSEDKVTYLD